jgi:RNA recognition motif-containing protein
MESKLYIGNLSYTTTEDALKELFSQVGEVKSVVIIVNKMSGKSKGFGFVEMASQEEAQKAIEALNGQELDGRNIIVDIARPPKPRQKRFRR